MAAPVDGVAGALVGGALKFAAMLTFFVISLVAYAKYTGEDPQITANKYKERCGPGTLCSDSIRGWQAVGGKRRVRKTRRHRSRPSV